MVVDFDSVSEFEREELRKIASNEYYPEKEFDLSDIVGFGQNVAWVFLVLDGVRPACEFTMILRGDGLSPTELPFEDVMYELPVRFASYMKNGQDEDGETYLHIEWVFYEDVSGEQWLDDILTQQKDIEVVEREAGALLGYPDDVVTAFTQDDCIRVQEVVSKYDFTQDELRYLEYIPYKIPDSESGIERGIEVGRKWDARLRELASEYEYLDGLEWWADWTLEQGEATVNRASSD